jgi:hypothetical protein
MEKTPWQRRLPKPRQHRHRATGPSGHSFLCSPRDDRSPSGASRARKMVGCALKRPQCEVIVVVRGKDFIEDVEGSWHRGASSGPSWNNVDHRSSFASSCSSPFMFSWEKQRSSPAWSLGALISFGMECQTVAECVYRERRLSRL